MITLNSKQSAVFGDVYSLDSALIDHFRVRFNDKQINLIGQDNKTIISFFTQDNDLYYQYYQGDPIRQGQRQKLTDIMGIMSQIKAGEANGVPQLDSQSKILRNQLPFNIYKGQYTQLPNTTGQDGDLFVTLDTLDIYTWVSNQWSPLSQTSIPTGNVDNNNQKITNLAPGTLSNDAVTLGQLDRNHFIHSYIDSDITDIIPGSGNSYVPFNIHFLQFIEPTTLVPPILSNIQFNTDNTNPTYPFTVFTLQSGVYSISIKTLVQYQGSTQYPIKFQLYDLETGIINYTAIEADRTDNFQQKKITNNNLVLRAVNTRHICLQFLVVPQFINMIAPGTSMYIQRID